MAIRVEVYTVGGMASGILARPGTLREALTTDAELRLDHAAWQAIGDAVPRSAGILTFASDDILFAVADEAPSGPMHAAWHHVLLDAGPYVLEGELATMPGFDPGRSLTRPSGEWVLLRDVRLSILEHPEAGVSMGDHALVNRYGVERIRADLMLGFFFPGAAVDATKSAAAGLG
ncbi:MAG: hypothetical protein ACXW4H_00795 [Candidatus Limnocylindrales bacterium]